MRVKIDRKLRNKFKNFVYSSKYGRVTINVLEIRRNELKERLEIN